MVALQIRDVPDDVRDLLVQRARARGQSLQGYLLTLVENDARRAANTTLLERFAHRQDGSRLSARQADAVRDRERAERDARATGRR